MLRIDLRASPPRIGGGLSVRHANTVKGQALRTSKNWRQIYGTNAP